MIKYISNDSDKSNNPKPGLFKLQDTLRAWNIQIRENIINEDRVMKKIAQWLGIASISVGAIVEIYLCDRLHRGNK